MAAPLSLSLSVSLCVCVSLSVSLYLCLSPSPVCLIAEGMWSSCRRLQNSTRHFRELMSLYYCTSSKQAALCNLRVSIRPLARVTHKAYHRRLHENISWRCRRAARVGRGPAAPYAQTPLALRPVGIRRGSQWAVCCTRSLACAGRRDAAPGARPAGLAGGPGADVEARPSVLVPSSHPQVRAQVTTPGRPLLRARTRSPSHPAGRCPVERGPRMLQRGVQQTRVREESFLTIFGAAPQNEYRAERKRGSQRFTAGELCFPDP